MYRNTPETFHIPSSRRLPSVRPKSTAAYSVATPAKKRLPGAVVLFVVMTITKLPNRHAYSALAGGMISLGEAATIAAELARPDLDLIKQGEQVCGTGAGGSQGAGRGRQGRRPQQNSFTPHMRGDIDIRGSCRSTRQGEQ
jgi:hypothetical protein